MAIRTFELTLPLTTTPEHTFSEDKQYGKPWRHRSVRTRSKAHGPAGITSVFCVSGKSRQCPAIFQLSTEDSKRGPGMLSPSKGWLTETDCQAMR